jgi:ubiquinone/menaquinone biosynthesis C-methylase UbiE
VVNNFNFIAPFYDFLAKLIFGKSLIESQAYFLSEINESDTVLILGGGTGKLLEALPKCKRVSFLDLSEKMIDHAKKRESKSTINFIQADFLNHDFESIYDVIICPFFLDCFDVNSLNKVLRKVKSIISKEGRLIVTDFQKTKSNGLLLKLMHLFFIVFTSIQSRNIKNIHAETLLVRFNYQKENFFHRNMIFSRLYRNL